MNNISQNSSRFAPPFSMDTLRSFVEEVNDEQVIVLNRNDRGEVQDPPLILGEFNGHQLTDETARRVNGATRDALYAVIGAVRNNRGEAFYSGSTIDDAFQRAGLSPDNDAARGEPITGSRIRVVLETLDNNEALTTSSSSVSQEPSDEEIVEVSSDSEEEKDDFSLPDNNDGSSMQPLSEQLNNLNILPAVDDSNRGDSMQSLSEQSNNDESGISGFIGSLRGPRASDNNLAPFWAVFQRRQQQQAQNRNQQPDSQ
ncbi:MAG: hypothetical protein ACH346_07790 [Chthoniobacterales bacterium]